MFVHPFFIFNNRLLREAVAGAEDGSWLTILLVSIYAAILVALSFYGGHRWTLILRYLKARKAQPGPKRTFADDELPGITIQLPIFNEKYVIDRLLASIGSLDYPRDRLDVQVLDDSTDETVMLARRAVARWRDRGLPVRHIHRKDRTGFKAGALENGLRSARFDLIAVFDADFCPEPDFLRRIVHYFSDPEVGVVQSRWGHLNREDSLLTKVQAMMLDGHFLVEHPARNRNGFFFNFNGTGGIWRRAAIEDGGGWQHDTLTEDLDLSYRAQMAGWKFIYDPSVVCPAELPVEMNAFKNQQHRWAKGSIQVMKKILPEILRSDVPRRQKLEAFIHLTGNLCYLLMFVMCLMTLPMLMLRARIMDGTMGVLIDGAIFLSATASVIAFYAFSQVVGYRDWPRRVLMVPMMLAVGIGLAVNQCKAVVEALIGHETPFVRTPKYNQGAGTDRQAWLAKAYRGVRDMVPWIELAFALYYSVTVIYALVNGLYGTLPFLLLFLVGFWYVAVLSLFHGRSLRRSAAAPTPARAST